MKRPVLAIIAAAVLAILAGLGVFVYAASAEDRAVASAGQRTTVVVTTADIGVGVTFSDAVTQGRVEEREVPVDLAPPGAVTSIAAVDPAFIAVVTLAGNQMVMLGDFASELPVVGPLAVPEGLIGMSLQLADPARVGTFLRPGSEIAVYATIEESRSEADASTTAVTNVILDRVTVLGVGTATQTQSDQVDEQSSQSEQTALVTVAVTQEQSTRLVHAVQTGALYLGLLAEGTEITAGPDVTDAELFPTAIQP